MGRKVRLLQLEFGFVHAGGIHANEDAEFARLGIVFHLLIPELQRIHVNREADRSGFARFQVDLLEEAVTS